ncbi:claudin-15-like [Tiliqua scincoides]|uniref:claudin-15-like n=1 Tax=Tiliqua scincoides TaxID=71010 RepID=UPI00346353AD
MASLAMQISALLLSLLGFLFLFIITVSNHYWRVSTVYGSVITTSTLYENLWQSCAEDSTGISNCRAFNTLLALPAYIQACRALMIISLILGMCGTVLTLLGLRCTQLGNNSAATKTKMAVIGGMIFILAGLSSMVAISWYAARITTEFFDSLYGGTKYELGYALYMGWAGSLLSTIGGIFLTCSCNKKHRSKDYKYAAAQKAHEPHIYIKQSETVTSVKDYV